jgi:hypothetical protein
MDAALLRKILTATGAFRAEGDQFTLDEGHEAVVTVARETYAASLVRVRSLVVTGEMVTVVTAADGRTTTFVEPSAVVSVAVREEVRSGDRKRPGFV